MSSPPSNRVSLCLLRTCELIYQYPEAGPEQGEEQPLGDDGFTYRLLAEGQWYEARAARWFLLKCFGEGLDPKGILVLTFKGTAFPPDTPAAQWEWMVDFNKGWHVVPSAATYVLLHRGAISNLWYRYPSTRDRVVDRIATEMRQADDNDTKIYVTGHSLGALYATCAYFFLPDDVAHKIHRVVTFAPPLALSNFSKEAARTARDESIVWHFVYNIDVVPRVLLRENQNPIGRIVGYLGHVGNGWIGPLTAALRLALQPAQFVSDLLLWAGNVNSWTVWRYAFGQLLLQDNNFHIPFGSYIHLSRDRPACFYRHTDPQATLKNFLTISDAQLEAHRGTPRDWSVFPFC